MPNDHADRGRKGGIARAKVLSASRRTEIGKAAAEARWKNHWLSIQASSAADCREENAQLWQEMAGQIVKHFEHVDFATLSSEEARICARVLKPIVDIQGKLLNRF
jgi:hypothetical protein